MTLADAIRAIDIEGTVNVHLHQADFDELQREFRPAHWTHLLQPGALITTVGGKARLVSTRRRGVRKLVRP